MSAITQTVEKKSPPKLRVKPDRKTVSKTYFKVAPGSAAEDALVRQYIPLVKTMVGRMAMGLPSHVDPEELYSSSLSGLLNAIRNFDPDGGSSFESYARVRIRGAMLDELRRMDWVPRSVHSKSRKVQQVMREMEQKKGRTLSEEEMAKAMKMSLEEYQQLLEEIRPATFVCLDSAQTGESDDSSRYESIPDPSQENPVEGTERRELARIIGDRIQALPDMQRKVLALYYFEDLRLREIAEVFGVTESRICQIHAQAILAIKGYLQQSEAI